MCYKAQKSMVEKYLNKCCCFGVMKKLGVLILFLFFIPLATALECGDVVLQDQKMDRDLKCDDDGLIIAEDGVLDCQGLTLEGNVDRSGIVVRGDSVVIINCNITGFGNGIKVERSENVNILDTFLEGNVFGIGLENATNVLMRRITIIDSTVGIFASDSTYSEIDTTFIDVDEDIRDQTPVEDEEEEEEEVEENVTEEVVEEEEEVEENVTVEEEPEEIVQVEVGGEAETQQELLNKTIKLVYNLDIVDPVLLDERIEKLQATLKNVDINRRIVPDEDSGKTKVIIIVSPKQGYFSNKKLINFNLYEQIPKCFANVIDVIVFDQKPTNVLDEDPLVVWHFDVIDGRVSVSYTVNKLIGENCEKLFQNLAIAEKIDSRFKWLPLILIPLIAIVVIFFARFAMKK